MKITKHTQSCFLIEEGESKVLVDPGRFLYELEDFDINSLKDINTIILTHEHSDHYDVENLKTIIQNCNPQILTTLAVKEKLANEGITDKIKIFEPDQPEIIGELTATRIPSQHGDLPDGTTPPEIAGFVITNGNKSFCHPSDTTFLDSSINADIIAVPICGVVVMDIDKAKEELLKLKPQIAIPIHYDNSKYPVNVNDFAETMQNTGIEVRILKPGEFIEI